MAASGIKSPLNGLQFLNVTPGKDKGMTPLSDDLGIEKKALPRKSFSLKSPLKPIFKEPRTKIYYVRRNIRFLATFAALTTLYSLFGPRLRKLHERTGEEVDQAKKFASHHAGNKTKESIPEDAIHAQNNSSKKEEGKSAEKLFNHSVQSLFNLTDDSASDQIESSSATANQTSVDRKNMLKTLNLLHLEIHNLTQGLTAESELERLNFAGKSGDFGGMNVDKAGVADQTVEKSEMEDGYEEKVEHHRKDSAAKIIKLGAEVKGKESDSLSKSDPDSVMLVPFEEWTKKVLLKIPANRHFLWKSPKSDNIFQCIERSETHKVPVENRTNGYLMVTANGGLNQMRSAICDMVAVTRIMNATLVVPGLDHTSFWKDSSEFEDIFDVDHFIRELKQDIRIVKQLPTHLQSTKPYLKVPISWSPAKYYRSEVLPVLKKFKVVYFPLTDSRLANNDISVSIQRVRCRANYRALKHTRQIEQLSNSLISKLRAKGPYIGLHLRYEKDMLAFTGCVSGLQPHEAEELRAMRLGNERWKEKDIDSRRRRAEGACPLTPRETGLFLRALGFPNLTVIYIAAGEIFGTRGLQDLLALYPNTFTHASLASKAELALLQSCQNRAAAVDYSVAFESSVFVATFEGNMARTVQGHRRFEGHRRTVMPHRKVIVELVDRYDSGQLGWAEFRAQVRAAHRGRDGAPLVRVRRSNPKLEDNFFANPMPGCLCQRKTGRWH